VYPVSQFAVECHDQHAGNIAAGPNQVAAFADVYSHQILLKNYFEGCWLRLIAANLKSDSFSDTVPGR
jgi:hypothetical protein